MSQEFTPTAEQLAMAEERRRKKEQRELAAAKEAEEKSRILPREWLTVQDVPSIETGRTVRVMSWNEVDQLDKLLPVLDGAGYAWVYKAGPRKKHGCLIAYRKEAYTLADEEIVLYDEQDVREDGSDRARRGSSFRTKNIASLVRLRRSGTMSEGLIVATTHLFWHPSYTYERTRQAGILLREVVKFRDKVSSDGNEWPCIVAGDFNFPPDDPAYSLMMGDPLLPEQKARLAASRVVHITIDPDVSATPNVDTVEGEEGGEVGKTDPDKVITNARPASADDGLLADNELQDLFSRSGAPMSIYDEGQRRLPSSLTVNLTFQSRQSVDSSRHGGFEPVWTSYTHYWQSVLDYIFVLQPRRLGIVTKIAQPHQADVLTPGLPQKGVCGSDHISLGAELFLPT
ncbi:hypothetical protein POSPLADRAFT_1042669 [Postia placenta MAD-698-R-SB12]|uniref:Endonuclease/exonuclease/phosphatase domain-containing protein n=1 Tax=Postia placenta MAD-698-R-SB12 TaxID=670580 RepID=A0A1X6NFP1_9APHY|nr:hypothetical protein POSPLADRAFT_1042669 [Postia placenta MAD-698-R-SB12]OSX67455.1 hypothetical protein POSPLADRAFT_1042669 [Postia placenta MAD-698-R-SB12]